MNNHFNMLHECSPFPYLCVEKSIWKNFLPFFWKILFIYFQREGKARRKRRKETLMWQKYQLFPLVSTLTGDWTHNPGMYSDQELNQRPFALWDDTQPTEPHQSGVEEFSYEIAFISWIWYNTGKFCWLIKDLQS